MGEGATDDLPRFADCGGERVLILRSQRETVGEIVELLVGSTRGGEVAASSGESEGWGHRRVLAYSASRSCIGVKVSRRGLEAMAGVYRVQDISTIAGRP